MEVLLLTASFDDRAGAGRIASRIGLGKDAETFDATTDLCELLQRRATAVACVLVDEAQFLTKDQVWQRARHAEI